MAKPSATDSAARRRGRRNFRQLFRVVTVSKIYWETFLILISDLEVVEITPLYGTVYTKNLTRCSATTAEVLAPTCGFKRSTETHIREAPISNSSFFSRTSTWYRPWYVASIGLMTAPLRTYTWEASWTPTSLAFSTSGWLHCAKG